MLSKKSSEGLSKVLVTAAAFIFSHNHTSSSSIFLLTSYDACVHCMIVSSRYVKWSVILGWAVGLRQRDRDRKTESVAIPPSHPANRFVCLSSVVIFITIYPLRPPPPQRICLFVFSRDIHNALPSPLPPLRPNRHSLSLCRSNNEGGGEWMLLYLISHPGGGELESHYNLAIGPPGKPAYKSSMTLEYASSAWVLLSLRVGVRRPF